MGIVLTLVALLAAQPALARWTFEAMLGNAASLPTTLAIDLEGEPMREHSAEWETRGFEPPLYYAARIACGDSTRAWAIDFVHHKIYLGNPPPEVQSYEVSHGCNLLLLSHVFLSRRWHAATGIGAVIAHPENEIGGVPLTGDQGAGGYVLTGPAIQAVGGYRLPLWNSWFGTVEARITGAHVRVPVANGFSSFQNVAFHVLAGVGWGTR
jgi:hypothetical protein